MPETLDITVDDLWLANALTVTMQMRDELPNDSYLVVLDKSISELNDYIDVVVEIWKDTVN